MGAVFGHKDGKRVPVAVNDQGHLISQQSGSNTTDFAKITPSNTVDLPKPCIGIAVEVTGALVGTKLDGTDVTIPAALLAPGVVMPFSLKRIKATGTTATGIWVFYA